MRARGNKYWEWASVDLHTRNYDERLENGALINIQARHSAASHTQLFVGVYGEKGVLIAEELYDSRPGETMTQAIEWGVEKARALSGKADPLPTVAGKPEALPRKGSRSHR